MQLRKYSTHSLRLCVSSWGGYFWAENEGWTFMCVDVRPTNPPCLTKMLQGLSNLFLLNAIAKNSNPLHLTHNVLSHVLRLFYCAGRGEARNLLQRRVLEMHSSSLLLHSRLLPFLSSYTVQVVCTIHATDRAVTMTWQHIAEGATTTSHNASVTL